MLKWSGMGARERDQLVAEKVMDYRVGAGNSCSCWKNACPKHGTFPEYSAQIAAAWEVVERVRSESRLYTFDVYVTSEYVCAVFSTQKEYKAWADSAPEAICLAALKIRGVEIE